MSDPGDTGVLQRALEQSTGGVLTGPAAQVAAAAAWSALTNDLRLGGWENLTRQAVVVTPSPRPAPEPGEVVVTMIWTGTRPLTGASDRRRSLARATPAGDGHWQIKILT